MSENTEEVQPNSTQPGNESPKLPGGEVRMKPIEINGIYYDPLHPPKLYTAPDGKQVWLGGTKIDKNTAYSMMFWAKPQPKGTRDAMTQSVESAIKSGEFSSFAAATKTPEGKMELEQESQEKLSAHRILAQEMGFTIGLEKFNEGSGTVQAKITKTEPRPPK